MTAEYKYIVLTDPIDTHLATARRKLGNKVKHYVLTI